MSGVVNCVVGVVDCVVGVMDCVVGVVCFLVGMAESLSSLVVWLITELVWSVGVFSLAVSEWRSRWRAWCLRSVRALFSLSTSRLKESWYSNRLCRATVLAAFSTTLSGTRLCRSSDTDLIFSSYGQRQGGKNLGEW